MKIRPGDLASILEIPVIPIVASKNKGLGDLVEAIDRASKQHVQTGQKQHVEYGSEVKGTIDHAENILEKIDTQPYPKHWAAMKLLEGDEKIGKLIKERIPSDTKQTLDDFLLENEPAAVDIATLRFEWVAKIASKFRKNRQSGGCRLLKA